MAKHKCKSTSSKMVPRKKPAAKLETCFCCPFCSHSGSVERSIDLKNLIADAACLVCKERYATKAHPFTEPVNIYSEWIDECQKANQEY